MQPSPSEDGVRPARPRVYVERPFAMKCAIPGKKPGGDRKETHGDMHPLRSSKRACCD